MKGDWTSSLDLLIEREGGQGVRRGIESAIRQAIHDGRLKSGVELPSTRALASDLGVARGTVSEAYGQLNAEGYLLTQQGAPTRVAWTPTAAEAAPPKKARPALDLRPGHTNVSDFPRRAWTKAICHAIQKVPAEGLGYGDNRGRVELRTALAGYLGRARGVRTDADGILVCGGFTQAITILCQYLRERGARAVALEDPCAPRYRDIVRRAGLAVLPVPCDSQGMDVSALRRSDADAVLVTPAHQYPLGVTLSPSRREELVNWARSRGALIVEDDYDGEFRFDQRPISALQSLDGDHVVYVGTASKSLAPGLRLGWLTTPPRLRAAVIGIKERWDRGSGLFEQLALANLITTGDFDHHVRRMRGSYRRRRALLLDTLARCTPGVQVASGSAGLHLTALLPGDMAETDVVAAAAQRSLLLRPLGEFWAAPAPAADRPQGLVIGYGTPPTHAFKPALAALAEVLTAGHCVHPADDPQTPGLNSRSAGVTGADAGRRI